MHELHGLRTLMLAENLMGTEQRWIGGRVEKQTF